MAARPTTPALNVLTFCGIVAANLISRHQILYWIVGKKKDAFHREMATVAVPNGKPAQGKPDLYLIVSLFLECPRWNAQLTPI